MALLTLLLSPWLSPAAAWFIFVNAVVGAIAIMSTSGTQAEQGGGGGAVATSSSWRRLCRSGSSSMVLDRLRSFFTFPMHATASGGIAEPLPIDGIDNDSTAATSASHCYYFCSREAEAAAASATQVCTPERNPQVVAATAGGMAAISAARPSAPVAIATAEDHAPSAPPPPLEEEDEDKAEPEAESEQHHDESISLDEAYALAQQHRTQPLPSPPVVAAAASATATTARAAALPTQQKKKKKKEPAMAVVADWRRVSNSKAGEAALEGKAELNARAELFIRQFREDLRLQRLNSILKHTHALRSPTATAAR